MSEIAALVRAHALAAASYRVRSLLSLVGLVVMVVPIFFVAGALEPVVEESIRDEGGHYFAFLIVGMATLFFVAFALDALAGAISTGIHAGTIEALLSTPARPATIFAGLAGYAFLWAVIRATVLIAAATALGMNLAWTHLPAAAVIVLLLVLAYAPFGLLSAAAVLAWRTPTPLTGGVLTVSVLLGGVYYSTTVIPSWIQHVSAFVPLTYGLRALRRCLLDGASLSTVAGDLLLVAAFAVLLFAVSVPVFRHAMRFARRAGTLSYY